MQENCKTKVLELAAVMLIAAFIWSPFILIRYVAGDNIAVVGRAEPPSIASGPLPHADDNKYTEQGESNESDGYKSVEAARSQALAAWAQFFAAIATLFAIGWQGVRQQKLAAAQTKLQVRQTFIAKRQAKAAELQNSISADQTDILIKQKEISRQAFFASHRPRLRVRNFSIDYESANQESGAFTGQFYLINIGASDAEIINGVLIVDWRKGNLPMKRPYDGNEPTFHFPHEVFAKGRSKTILFGGADVRQDQSLRTADIEMPHKHSIMGYVDYLDELGRRYRTAFCRTYDRSSERFTRSENEDYEHEE